MTVIWFWPGHSFPVVGIWTAITIPADPPTSRLLMYAWNVVVVSVTIDTSGVYKRLTICEPAGTVSSIVMFVAAVSPVFTIVIR